MNARSALVDLRQHSGGLSMNDWDDYILPVTGILVD